MLVLGLLLILGATVVTVGAIYDAGEPATVEIVGRSVETTVAGVFLAGAVTMLLFLVGVWALMASMGRARRKRAERKETKSRQRESVDRLQEEREALRAENERLAEQLAERPGATGSGATAAGAAGAATTGSTTAGEPGGHDSYGSRDTVGDGGHESDRVVDHHTDPTAPEHTTSGRHGERI